MDKIKTFIKKPIGKIALIIVSALIGLVILARVVSPAASVSDLASSMQSQKDTVVKGDVKITTQETLNTVVGQQSRMEHELSDNETAEAKWEKAEAAKNEAFRQQLLDALKSAQAAAEEAQTELKKEQEHTEQEHEKATTSSEYVIGEDSPVVQAPSHSTMSWVGDAASKIKPANTIDSTQSVLHTDETDKPKSTPFYTIPENTALVNVRPLQPLIGVIPTDGTVIDPETILFTVGKKGLLANNWQLPPALKGVQGSATCMGVFNFDHSAVKCNITSLTFIFPDGRVQTVTSEADKPLGKLTDEWGNDYILGTYEGNAVYAASGTGLFSGLQGWGGAFANSQVDTQSNSAGTFSMTTFKNANAYAGGEAIQSSAQAMNQWWQQLLKSTTNYVYVNNVNAKTKQFLILNAVINQSIDIDYNPTNRKVIYEHQDNNKNNSLD
jgi:hypothetical protein